MKLTQKELGSQLGVNPYTILNWEKGNTTPPIPYIPAIHRFLGYDPFPSATRTIAEQLIAKRRELGWSQNHCARVLGVDPVTWGGWEKGKTILFRKHMGVVAQFLDVSAEEIEKAMAGRRGKGDRVKKIATK